MVDRIRIAWAFLRAFFTQTPNGALKLGRGHRRVWFYPDGSVLPQIAGADGADDSGDDDDDSDDDQDDDDADDSDDDDDQDDDADADADKDKDKDIDWKAMSRKHERRAKTEAKKRKALEAKQKKDADADKTDRQREIDKAKEEGKAAAKAESDAERRADRLEVAVTRLAAKGISLGEGDDAETVKFADPEDALVHLERAIKRGDVDEDDIFDDGKVQTEAVTEALGEILEAKPHLKAGARADDDDGKGKGKKGSGDGGKGKGGARGVADLSIADLDKRVRRGQ